MSASPSTHHSNLPSLPGPSLPLSTPQTQPSSPLLEEKYWPCVKAEKRDEEGSGWPAARIRERKPSPGPARLPLPPLHQAQGEGTHLLHVVAAAGTWVNPDTPDFRGRGHLLGPVLSYQIHIYLTLVRASTLCLNHPSRETLW